MPGGYDAIYKYLIPQLENCSFEDAAARLGLELTAQGDVSVRFLGKDYLISKQGVEVPDGEHVHVNTKSVLLYYVLSPGAGEPKNEFVPFRGLMGTLEPRNVQKGGIMDDPLVRELGGDYPLFAKAAQMLDGESVSSEGGKHEWFFLLLPKLPFRVVFYELDEEFPAEIQLFLDRSAPYFLEFECLAFMVGCFTTAMLETAKKIRQS
ncbi:DUF3786 domain-containing protein [Christensenellaceae bacterium OttesenSCG-928-K19]|nr:DUF3786 domain-containing protein [Christensenellaceae bacterium OttesenSCG-928-K19]